MNDKQLEKSIRRAGRMIAPESVLVGSMLGSVFVLVAIIVIGTLGAVLTR